MLFRSIIERVSYAIGMKLGTDMKNEGDNLNPKAVVQAIEDVLAGKEPRFSPMELEQAYRVYAEARQMRQMEEMSRQARNNRIAGDKYLAENKLKEGVVTLESGVQYKIIKKGDGPTPKVTDHIKMNYTGRLIDGTQFASSEDPRVQEQAVPVQNLFPGLIDAVTRMPVGSTWEITLPSETAIGENPGGPGGPNSVYVFVIELREIVAAPAEGMEEGAAHEHTEDCQHGEAVAPEAPVVEPAPVPGAVPPVTE